MDSWWWLTNADLYGLGRIPVITPAGIVALKAVLLERRGPRRLEKLARDVFDLTVVASAWPPEVLAAGLREADRALVEGVASVLLRHFSATSDRSAAPRRAREWLRGVDPRGFARVERLATVLAQP
jgi:hypothetical protein